jgi:hypothetical protein
MCQPYLELRRATRQLGGGGDGCRVPYSSSGARFEGDEPDEQASQAQWERK